MTMLISSRPTKRPTRYCSIGASFPETSTQSRYGNMPEATTYANIILLNTPSGAFLNAVALYVITPIVLSATIGAFWERNLPTVNGSRLRYVGLFVGCVAAAANITWLLCGPFVLDIFYQQRSQARYDTLRVAFPFISMGGGCLDHLSLCVLEDPHEAPLTKVIPSSRAHVHNNRRSTIAVSTTPYFSQLASPAPSGGKYRHSIQTRLLSHKVRTTCV